MTLSATNLAGAQELLLVAAQEDKRWLVYGQELFVQDVQVLGPQDSLTIFAGKRHLTLKASDLEHYYGERGRRGAKLPRGFQNVDSMAVERKGA